MAYFDDPNEPDSTAEVTFIFERLDVTDGPRTVISSGPRASFANEFRRLNARYPVKFVGFDARPVDHPDVLAEEAKLRADLRAARRKSITTSRRNPSSP